MGGGVLRTRFMTVVSSSVDIKMKMTYALVLGGSDPKYRIDTYVMRYSVAQFMPWNAVERFILCDATEAARVSTWRHYQTKWRSGVTPWKDTSIAEGLYARFPELKTLPRFTCKIRSNEVDVTSGRPLLSAVYKYLKSKGPLTQDFDSWIKRDWWRAFTSSSGRTAYCAASNHLVPFGEMADSHSCLLCCA